MNSDEFQPLADEFIAAAKYTMIAAMVTESTLISMAPEWVDPVELVSIAERELSKYQTDDTAKIALLELIGDGPPALPLLTKMLQEKDRKESGAQE